MPEQGRVVKLEINLAPEVAAAVHIWKRRKGISATEAIRRAIAVWNFVEHERASGNLICVVERDALGRMNVRPVDWTICENP